MTRYIDQLNENTAPVAGDYLLCSQASAGTADKDRKLNINKLAVLANVQSFTAIQTFAPSATNTDAIYINMPVSASAGSLEIAYNGALRQQFAVQAALNRAYLVAFDNGANGGPYLLVDRNNNITTPAAGYVQLSNRAGTAYNIWPDASGNLRIGTSTPTSANDSTGTVIGTQTSSLDSKDIVGNTCSPLEALRSLREAAASALSKFVYKSGAFNNQVFDGVIVDYAPRYGMDRDQEHPAGKSLNMITLFNDLILAIDNLANRVEALEGAQ